MTNDSEVSVLICGAGTAGLTLAIDLARRGVSFRLIDKLEEPFRGSRGKGIQPRTQEVFEDLGILDRIVAAAIRCSANIQRMAVFATPRLLKSHPRLQPNPTNCP